MQKSWRDDPNKCTFIVLAREQCEIDATKREVVVSDCLHAMVGDVNLFLSEIDDDDDEAGERGSAQRTENDHTSRIQAEQKRINNKKERNCLTIWNQYTSFPHQANLIVLSHRRSFYFESTKND